ncbi:hypothetical protein K010075C41_13510 [Sellimonas intestinalis]
MFLTQAVANNGFPFEIKRLERNPYAFMDEEMLLQKLEKSREDAVLGNYKDADTVIAKMKCGKSPRKKELAFANSLFHCSH